MSWVYAKAAALIEKQMKENVFSCTQAPWTYIGAWHLATRGRVLCQDAPHGDTVAAVSQTMAQCIWLCVCVCLSVFVFIYMCHVTCTNPSVMGKSIACTVHMSTCETVVAAEQHKPVSLHCVPSHHHPDLPVTSQIWDPVFQTNVSSSL